MHDPITAAKLEEVRQSEAATKAAKREQSLADLDAIFGTRLSNEEQHKRNCKETLKHHERYFPQMFNYKPTRPIISDR